VTKVRGKFGRFGGRFVPEVLMHALDELEDGYRRASRDAGFRGELDSLLADYAGRPTPIYMARRFSESAGCRVYLKREDLVHGGAHKLNNTLGQALLARYLGKSRVIAETGAGQHGVATAMACAALGMDCTVYMGRTDTRRQRPNVQRMELLGASVVPVDSGSRTLKDAINEALRDWVTNVENTHYLLGSVVGPHPYPSMVRDFQSVIGREARERFLEREGRLPDSVVACCGGGSNAMGTFVPFLDDENVRLVAVEAGGDGLQRTEKAALHSASLCDGEDGVLHGAYSKLLQDAHGQILESQSIAAGLDYSGVGPQLAHLAESGRIEPHHVTDAEALEAFHSLSELEGILPALESSHALAHVLKRGAELGELVLVCLSGRGDKDLDTVLDSTERGNAS